ncbi:uncharacterized protein [Asterias amurensis]|uniref:uncharacterized protein n=1 Tax=Asterias amurensis TaxID=7602 RepID=UPI003AB26BE5
MESDMALFRPIVSLLLVVTAAIEVYGCVCYVGQEPNPATGERYGWSLAEQRPCECTEFRLGGVNMKPQLKPYEVKIGKDCKKDQNALTTPPRQVPGSMKHVSVGAAGVWAVDVNDEIYYMGFRGCSNTLIQGGLHQLDVGMNSVWGTAHDDKIYYRQFDVSNPDMTAGWTHVSGLLKHVSVSQKGHVWGVNSGNDIYHRLGANVNRIPGDDWLQITGTLKQISVGSGGVWGITLTNQPNYRSGTYGDPDSDPDGSLWKTAGPTSVSLKYVSSGDVIYVVDVNDAIYYRAGISAETPTGKAWEKIGGSLKQIEAISGTFWGVDAENSVYTNESLSCC